jgi:hypothetical protein
VRYNTHGEYLRRASEAAEKRRCEIEGLFRKLFPDLLEQEQHDVIRLADVDEERLAEAILAEPLLLKPLLAVLNMGKRAPRKDLGFEIDTFRPKINAEKARVLAGYLKPLFPGRIGLDTISYLDRYQFVDSFVRTLKGRWEKRVASALTAVGLKGKKSKFTLDGEKYEIDYAVPVEPPHVLGVDIKMIGHPLDKHKRGDEIIHKADAFKQVFPKAIFVAVVYYPFNEDGQALDSRLTGGGSKVDGVFHVGDDEESTEQAATGIVDLVSRSSVR